MADLTWLRPLWLGLIPLIVLVAWAGRARSGSLGGWDRAIDPAMLAALAALGRVVPGRIGGGRGVAVLAVLVTLALAGPGLRDDRSPAFRNLDAVVLVLDLSASTTTGTALAELGTAARLVLGQAGSRPVALVVFGGDAYLASPPTVDLGALVRTIGHLGPRTVPDPGSRPERGLALARAVIAATGILGGDVVLVSDGGGLGPAALAEAGRIVDEGARVSTVAIAPVAGAPPPAPGAMAALAEAGGGVAVRPGRAAALADLIGGDWADRVAAGAGAALVWRDLGPWLLLAALVPALALFRRGAA